MHAEDIHALPLYWEHFSPEATVESMKLEFSYIESISWAMNKTIV